MANRHYFYDILKLFVMCNIINQIQKQFADTFETKNELIIIILNSMVSIPNYQILRVIGSGCFGKPLYNRRLCF